MGEFASTLAMTNPAEFAEISREYADSTVVEVAADGAVLLSGTVIWDPSAAHKRTFWAPTAQHSATAGHDSAVGIMINFEDIRANVKGPYVHELPRSFFDLLASDLEGELAHNYRGYIRNEVKPVLDHITGVLHSTYAAMELPDVQWLTETFPGSGPFDSPNQFLSDSIAYTRAWDRVLADWDSDRIGALFPPHHMNAWFG
eukprot:SAG31_NODE_8258_length_1487_cov_1.469741_2_plen_201_part_00